MACFNKAPFILQFVCPPLHEAVKPQASLFKIKKAGPKPSPSALLKAGLFSRSLREAPSQLRKAVAPRGAGTPALPANYPALCFCSSVCSGHVNRGKFLPFLGRC